MNFGQTLLFLTIKMKIMCFENYNYKTKKGKHRVVKLLKIS